MASQIQTDQQIISLCVHLNIPVIPEDEWEWWFGKVKVGHPWVYNFWPGFFAYVRHQYAPVRYVPPYLMAGNFRLPQTFSRAQALSAVSSDNPTSWPPLTYPAWFYPCDAETVYMTCFHQVIMKQKGWRVHRDRVQLFPGEWWLIEPVGPPLQMPTPSHLTGSSPTPLHLTSSTMVIEELEEWDITD